MHFVEGQAFGIDKTVCHDDLTGPRSAEFINNHWTSAAVFEYYGHTIFIIMKHELTKRTYRQPLGPHRSDHRSARIKGTAIAENMADATASYFAVCSQSIKGAADGAARA
jgi:hypothetical protein